MRYSTIVVYVREGNVVTPVRVSKFYGETCTRRLDWPELYGNHTSWVAEQVAATVARRKSQVMSESRRAA